ncbi:MAG: glycosyl hydrolase [Woeseiaceae bacterium]|nr:glycosyl hydrolase [Woeseiaceae bacterium]NIP21616.1 glycosyl hydrolase [Woeseiaceae bacterium]NIS90590.1 glycosyl hydrolase [Woeseiaceae bacterium]
MSGRHVAYGDGVYRSRDAGESWENMGLEDSQHIGMIRIDPRDSNTIFVAAQGPLWSGGGDRGLYKSTDGGENWRKVLGDGLGNTELDDQYTGVSEVHMDPRDPDVMYAVSWQRLRNVAVVIDGGPGTGIHKSVDGGETWRQLSEGLPEDMMGKTGLAVSPQNPDVIYATIELDNRTGGFWRSEDGGETWEKMNEYLSGGTGPHYYQEIFASPHRFDRVYQMDVQMHRTDNGGKDFIMMDHESKHSDHHAMAFRPDDPNYLIVGTDGGIYESFDEGETWRFVANLPVTQFYKVAVDYDEPFYNVYGGTQDNNSQGGPSRTWDISGIRNADWFITLFADGHQSAVDPTNPDIVYAEWQQGNLTRYDRRTGEVTYIRPQAREGEEPDRYNWDAPILISAHDPKTIFFASQRVWRSDDHGDSWTPISGDLTRDEDRVSLPIMGRTWSYDAPRDLVAMSSYNTIVNISQSPIDADVIYAGSDDGLISVTENGGETWRTIDELPGVPDGFFVNDIKADLHDADTVYVVVDDHKKGDFSPYILRSENRGRNWRSISSNLPERHVLWRVVQDHVKPELMFVASEFGVFFTVNGGGAWTKLKGGSPNIAFRDLAIQTRENDLVGATFGRSFYVLDDYSPLRDVNQDMLESGNVLFPVRKTPWYVPKRSLGCGEPMCLSSQGDSYFMAPNPDFGATFTYYLAEGFKSSKDVRREAEKELEAGNEDVAVAAWDTILGEDREDAPAIVFTVTNSRGNIVRQIEAPAEPGFHRVAWDLRYPALQPWTPEETNEYFGSGGVLVVPGTFSVKMQVRQDGVLRDLGEPQSFDVVSVRPDPVLPGSTQEQRVIFESQVAELSRAATGTDAALNEVIGELDAVKETLERSLTDGSLYELANSIQQNLKIQQDRLKGNQKRVGYKDEGEMTVTARLWHAGFVFSVGAYGPTPEQRESLRIGRALYDDIVSELDTLVNVEYAGLKDAMDTARVPWTPGRGIQP